MATREENLKKINEQLEQLSNEELEQIAGGAPVNYNPWNKWLPRKDAKASEINPPSAEGCARIDLI